MNIRKMIRDRMAALELNVPELARKAGVSHRLLYCYLDAESPTEIRSDKFLAILEALGLKIVARGK